MEGPYVCSHCQGTLKSIETDVIEQHIRKEVHIKSAPVEECKNCGNISYVNRVKQQIDRIVKNAPQGISEVTYQTAGDLHYKTIGGSEND